MVVIHWMQRFVLLFLLALLVGALNSCASRNGRTDGGGGSAGNPQCSAETAIEITFFRGQNAHRFVALDERTDAKLSSFIDRQLLREVRIGHQKYTELVEKTLG